MYIFFIWLMVNMNMGSTNYFLILINIQIFKPNLKTGVYSNLFLVNDWIKSGVIFNKAYMSPKWIQCFSAYGDSQFRRGLHLPNELSGKKSLMEFQTPLFVVWNQICSWRTFDIWWCLLRINIFLNLRFVWGYSPAFVSDSLKHEKYQSCVFYFGIS